MSFLTYRLLKRTRQQLLPALPTGEYEMLIKNAKESATPSGSENTAVGFNRS